LHGMQEVRGSIPRTSTNKPKEKEQHRPVHRPPESDGDRRERRQYEAPLQDSTNVRLAKATKQCRAQQIAGSF
jgi:hypothetical protein